MRIPVNYSRYRLDIRGHRLGIIRISLRRGRNPQQQAFIDHSEYFQTFKPASADDLKRWAQYLKHTYPELSHDNPEPSS